MTQEIQKIPAAEVATQTRPMDGNKAIMQSAGTALPLTMNELKFYGSMIHEAGLIPKTGAETAQQLEARAMAKVIAGHAYGFDPILSMRLFDVINGKLQPTSECVSVLIKRSGRYNYKVVTWTVTECDLLFVGKAVDGTWKPLGHSTFTITDAQKAGYTAGPNKHNWEKIPRNMLLARAITNGKRLFCADVMDPSGYFGQSGMETVESTNTPDDLEFAQPAQLAETTQPTATPVESTQESPVIDAEPVHSTPEPPRVDPEPNAIDASEPQPAAPATSATTPAEPPPANFGDMDSATEDLRASCQTRLDQIPSNLFKDMIAGLAPIASMAKAELDILDGRLKKVETGI